MYFSAALATLVVTTLLPPLLNSVTSINQAEFGSNFGSLPSKDISFKFLVLARASFRALVALRFAACSGETAGRTGFFAFALALGLLLGLLVVFFNPFFVAVFFAGFAFFGVFTLFLADVLGVFIVSEAVLYDLLVPAQLSLVDISENANLGKAPIVCADATRTDSAEGVHVVRDANCRDNVRPSKGKTVMMKSSLCCELVDVGNVEQAVDK